ncbi:TetR/AcrR family transcriptional regulator [Luteimicrobium sp. NPDC057192]|uniref:TetR/AcrR family transcriptional regulator n=1 Tax=Luteimicrobium sp. NPDC057192 TaxID=3346042 RepID=UPI0036338F1E
MTLTAKGLATRARIVQGAADFLRGTDDGEITLDDVRAITGTSKGQLFHYFPGGKDDLLMAVVRLEADHVLDDQQPYLANLTTWAAWERWRDVVVARYRAQGSRCSLSALMGQVGGVPGVPEVVRDLLVDWEAHLAAGIRSMQDAGEMRADLPAGRAAAALVAGIQGGVLLLRTTGDTRHLEAALDAGLDHLRAPAGDRVW